MRPLKKGSDCSPFLFSKNELAENLIGTDFYYLSTNYQNETLSGKYITAKNKALNYFNINTSTNGW